MLLSSADRQPDIAIKSRRRMSELVSTFTLAK